MWEYSIRNAYQVTDDGLENKLNELGQFDWEVYQIIKTDGMLLNSYQIFCKKQVERHG